MKCFYQIIQLVWNKRKLYKLFRCFFQELMELLQPPQQFQLLLSMMIMKQEGCRNAKVWVPATRFFGSYIDVSNNVKWDKNNLGAF